MDDPLSRDLELAVEGDCGSGSIVTDPVPAEVLAGAQPSPFWERLRDTYPATWVRRHRTPAGLALAGLVAVCAVATLCVTLRPPPLQPLTRAPVTGMSIRHSLPDQTPVTSRRITATYRVGGSASGSRFSIEGVSGPFLDSVSSQAGPRVDGAGQMVTVSATPDCRDPRSLDPPPAGYSLRIERTDSDGRVARGLVEVAGSPVDWADAVRRDCWQALGRGLRIESVTADAGRHAGQVDAVVVLRSSLSRDVEIGVIDVADVATVDAADSGRLPAGSSRSFHVRVPIADCSVPVLPFGGGSWIGETTSRQPAQLTWSIGPVGADPLTLVQTSLSPGELEVIGARARQACRPPGTSVQVVASRVVPENGPGVDRTGVSIELSLSVVTVAPRIVVGDDQTALTADARVAFTRADVTPTDHAAGATVVWHARCLPAGAEPPVLPVRVSVRGDLAPYSVVLDSADLAQSYAGACHIRDLSRLRANGWALPGP